MSIFSSILSKLGFGDKKEEVVKWADDWYAQQGRPGSEARQAQRPR